MRVAFTSSDGVVVDEHFGRTASFFVWDVDAERATFLEEVPAMGTSADDARPRGSGEEGGFAAGSDLARQRAPFAEGGFAAGSDLARQRAPFAEGGFAAGSDLEEDRTSARAAAVAGCAILYTVAIGGPAAAKLVARRVHPMKTAGPVPISELVSKLQGVLRAKPPPWLRKAMADGRPAADPK